MNLSAKFLRHQDVPFMIIMKKLIILFSLALPFVMAAQEEPQEFIEWSSKRLDWNDYMAKPAHLSDAAAITSTAISFEYHVRKNKLTYSISCRFSRTRSWGRFKTEYILGHEQGHFDITELYARKLSKALQEYTFDPRSYKEDLNRIYETVMKEKEDFQNEYDNDTDYSRKKDKQEVWLERIADLLEKYSNYSAYSKSHSAESMVLDRN
jgi:hypothetical protein